MWNTVPLVFVLLLYSVLYETCSFLECHNTAFCVIPAEAGIQSF
jgi:hypothetical protein